MYFGSPEQWFLKKWPKDRESQYKNFKKKIFFFRENKALKVLYKSPKKFFFYLSYFLSYSKVKKKKIFFDPNFFSILKKNFQKLAKMAKSQYLFEKSWDSKKFFFFYSKALKVSHKTPKFELTKFKSDRVIQKSFSKI